MTRDWKRDSRLYEAARRDARRLIRDQASILIRDPDFRPLFWLDFYGLTVGDLCIVPGGGDLVASGLRRRGIDPSSVAFTIWDVTDRQELTGDH